MIFKTTIINRQRKEALAKPLTIASLYCIALAFAAPLSSSVYSEYVYNYEANIASGPTGFRFTAKAHLELLYTSNGDTAGAGGGGQLVRLRLTQPKFYAGPTSDQPQSLVVHNKYNSLYDPDYDLYAHIVTLSNGTALIKELYTHEADATTFKNLKKSILLNLLPTSHHLKPISQQQQHDINEPNVCTDDNNDAQPELFSPDSISSVNIKATPRKSTSTTGATDTTTSNQLVGVPTAGGPTIFQTVEGYQNVTFRSRVFSEAESNLTTKFHLELVNELKSTAHERFDDANSIDQAIKLIDRQHYHADDMQLQRERRICSTHHCGRTLTQLFQDYKSSLTDESLATVDASVAFLRILDRLRDSQGTSANEILSVLKKMKGNDGVRSSFLDILAAVRTKDSILAALKHIKLAKNDDLDAAERFLSVLSVAAKTAAKMHLKRPLNSPYYSTPTFALKRSKEAKQQRAQMASLEFIAKEFLQILKQTPAEKWASHKLRWSTLLTLATLVNANNQEHNFENTGDELNESVSKLLLDELKACDHTDTDCRIVVLQAIGNVGNLSNDQFVALREQVLDSGRRESISAMKVLRDLLQNLAKDKPLSQEFYTNLRDLLFRVVYDNTQETTARVLAAEMIVRFLPSSLASEQLLLHLPSFGNNELATMIYSRMQSLRPDSLAKHHENWYWKSCIINGTSTSFVRTMAKTNSLNASYGVNVELLDKGKVLKESSFDVFLDTKQRTQDLFSLGIFARGMSLFSGGGGDGSENESTMAGMTLRLLGGYLRPYVFFTGTGELMSHIWSGTASEPTTAFNGDLLLIDHDEGYPLISGFVAEQQMRGVLSIDVSGKINISLWYKKSHAVVRTKAAVIVQASQSVFTSYDNFWHSHLFSFGGQALIDFVSDSSFSSTPYKLCLQVTQPEFIVRYNSRKHVQMMTNEVSRKITRKNFSIGAKSYSLNTENNKMCSLMNDEL